MAATKVEPYYLDPKFERFVVYYACSSPIFFGRIGHALDPEALGDEHGRLAIQAAQAVFADNGKGPASSSIVVQRLRRWSREGRATIDQIHAVAALFDAVEDAQQPPPPEGSVADELAPILKRRIQRSAVDTAIEEYQAKGDFSSVREAIQRADSVGVVDQSPGTATFGSTGGIEEIQAAATMEFLPTGVFELDSEIDGGMPRGQLGIAAGGSGDGKSMFLAQATCSAVRAGLLVAYASLELPCRIIHARLLANISGTAINVILGGGARLALDACTKKGMGGDAIVKFYTPQATTVEDVRAWVDAVGKSAGRPVDLLIVDYADKMVSLRKEEADYKAMRDVYEGLRLLAVERNIWCWTASQSRKKEKQSSKHNRDVEALADSMHKGRVADLVVTLNANEDGSEITLFVAKNRTGKSRVAVGPLPTDFALGRMVVV